jgi:hypothetical protein
MYFIVFKGCQFIADCNLLQNFFKGWQPYAKRAEFFIVHFILIAYNIFSK